MNFVSPRFIAAPKSPSSFANERRRLIIFTQTGTIEEGGVSLVKSANAFRSVVSFSTTAAAAAVVVDLVLSFDLASCTLALRQIASAAAMNRPSVVVGLVVVVSPLELTAEGVLVFAAFVLDGSDLPPHPALARQAVARQSTAHAEAELLRAKDIRRTMASHVGPGQASGENVSDDPRHGKQITTRFVVHRERDLHIVRTTTKAAALRALGWLESGHSFAGVVKRVAVGQPIGAVKGLFLGLTPERFVEQVLAHAIFKAHPRELVGPVKIYLGYYDFEVTKIHAPHQATLTEAEPGLRKELPELLRAEHLASASPACQRATASDSART